MANEKFCIFILTHGRPDSVYTFKALNKAGYTGSLFFLLDDQDKTSDRYKENFGKESVKIFSKKKIDSKIDFQDNIQEWRTITYARNAVFDVAEKLGYRYFMMLDDDYKAFSYKFDEDLFYKEKPIKNFDMVIESLLQFYKSINAKTIAIAQNGDFIGGAQNQIAQNKTLKRKAMNSFICDTKNRFWFSGRMNEDVCTYTTLSQRGKLFFTIPLISLNHKATQSTAGGMTDFYLDHGTYKKSFYSVISMPSSVKVASMGDHHRRLHHNVSWNNTAPLILSEKLKK